MADGARSACDSVTSTWLTAPRTEGFTVRLREEVGTERDWSGTGRRREQGRHGGEPSERRQSGDAPHRLGCAAVDDCDGRFLTTIS